MDETALGPVQNDGSDTGEDAVSIDVQATPHGVRDALDQVRAALIAWEVAAGDRGTVEMVLAEAMNNVVEHALRDEASSVFTLIVSRLTNGVRVHMIDPGRAMPGLRLPVQDPADLDVALEDLPEGGFGWGLIEQLTDELEYQRRRGRNHMRFRIPFRDIV